VFWINPYSQRNQRWRWLRPLEEAKAQEIFERELLQIRRDLADLKLELALRRPHTKYSPDQARVPKGNPGGGQWTSGQGDSNARHDHVRLAGDITGFTRHGINQAISRGVAPASMHDAVINPIQILPKANGTTQYVGRGAVVVLNPLGQVVTTWGK